MTKSITLDSFRHGRCQWFNATQASVSKDWPSCVRSNIREIQERRYAEKECVLANSRVTVVVENSREDFYVSEKIFHALRAGAVPVYIGAPNIRHLLPDPHAAILVDDFPSIDSAMKYASQVNGNETLWLKHTAWKLKQFAPGFDALLRDEFALCSVCEHYAEDARGGNLAGQALTGVSHRLAPCMISRFSWMKTGLRVPVVSMHDSVGVDAVFVVENGVADAEHMHKLSVLFGTTPVLLDDFALHKLTPKDRACFGDMPACSTLACAGREPLACMRHLFAAYLVVVHGLQNAAIFSGQVNATAVKKHWLDAMRGIPADYDVVDLGVGACSKHTGASDAQKDDKEGPQQQEAQGKRLACSGAYIVSQNGARRMLLGQAQLAQQLIPDLIISSC
jgi:hypothetical protein